MIAQLLKYLPQRNRLERIWKIAQVDFKKNFYNNKLGLFWAFLNPVMRLSIYYFAFTFFLERVREGIPNFALFLFSALIFWIEFSRTLKKGMKVIDQKRYLIENIKINKIDLFISLGLTSFLAFSFNISAYLIIATMFKTSFSSSLFLLPILILNLYLITIGLSMILSVLYLVVRDIVHLVDIGIIFGFWTSGVIFPTEKVLEKFPALYYANPFMGLFSNVRAILVYDSEINYSILNVNLIAGIVIYIIGFQIVTSYSQKVFEYL